MKKHHHSHRGFTLTEMLVVILIIVVLASLAFVSVTRAREAARRSASANNLRQFGVAITSFVADSSGYLPASPLIQGHPRLPAQAWVPLWTSGW